MSEPPFQRYTSSQIHWLLIEANKAQSENDPSDEGWVAAQALFCPYYVPLEGALGSDWGVIVNPDSAKFGKLVFEHEWCGCEVGDDGYALHGGGRQRVDEWRVESCRSMHEFRDKAWGICVRPADHAGRHRSAPMGREWR